jgi:hypothetical protein
MILAGAASLLHLHRRLVPQEFRVERPSAPPPGPALKRWCFALRLDQAMAG